MAIPLTDVRAQYASLLDELKDRIAEVLDSGLFILGPEVKAFEEEAARFLGAGDAIGVANGTDALVIVLDALGVGPGDEVVCPSFTFYATAESIARRGAIPVFADIDPATLNIDPADVAAKVTDRTKAILPVHLFGRPFDPAALPDGMPVVEDAAQALGALERGSRTAAVACSFYPTKNLGGICDGGAVLTDDAELAAEIRLLRAHGVTDDYVHTRIATNARLSEVAAAALRVELPHLDADNARRAAIVARYREAAPELRWHAPHPRHVYHLCVARVTERDRFRAQKPFGTAVHYPRALTQQPAYERFVVAACPEAEAWAAECVSLPCFPEMTEHEIEVVCRSLP